MKIRCIAPWVLIGCLAPNAFAGWTLTLMPPTIAYGHMVDGGASCTVAARPTSIANTAKGTGGAAHEYTVTCYGSADMKWCWKYTPSDEAPRGWASVEAVANVDGRFFVQDTPISFAHDTVVEVICDLFPTQRVRAEISDSRVFEDKGTTVGGGATVLGSGGTFSTTVSLSGSPQMFFYVEVSDFEDGAKCVNEFMVHWRTEGDAFLWVDDGWFYPGSGDYTMSGGSSTLVITSVCPTCGDDSDAE